MPEDLSTVAPGTAVRIDAVPDETTRARLSRLGFLDGPVRCERRIRNGPVIVRRNGTSLAIGRPLARTIAVSPTEHP